MSTARPLSIDWSRRAGVVETILDAAGLTPMVQLRRTAPAGVEVLCKVEHFGPSGSAKDRILPHIVRDAEERGELRRGMSLIEGTTGNTGIATAMVGAALGYRVMIVMPDGMSDERKRTIEDLRRGAGPDAGQARATSTSYSSGSGS